MKRLRNKGKAATLRFQDTINIKDGNGTGNQELIKTGVFLTNLL